MSQCPRCDVPLRPDTLGVVAVECCLECGGTWVSAADLSRAVRESPEALAPLDRRIVDRRLPPPIAQPHPLCPNCGHEFTARRVKGLESIPLLACEPCRMLFVPDGQLEAIHVAISPQTVPPAPAPAPAAEPEEEVDEEGEARAETREFWLRKTWPERIPGQPWLSWAVPNMPLWIAALLLLPAAILFGCAVGLRQENVWFGLLAVPDTYANVALRAFGLTIALWITWGLTGSRPMPFGFAYRLMLSLGAVAMVAVAVATCLILPTTGNYAAVFGFDLLLRFVLYRWALELEWQDVAVLVLVQGLLARFVPVLPSGIGLG